MQEKEKKEKSKWSWSPLTAEGEKISLAKMVERMQETFDKSNPRDSRLVDADTNVDETDE